MQLSLQIFCFLLGPEVRSQHFFYSSRSWRKGVSIFLALKVLYYCTYLKCRPLLEYQRRSFWLECLYRPGGGHRILVAIQNDNRACIQIEETSDRQKQHITWKEDNIGSIQTSPQVFLCIMIKFLHQSNLNLNFMDTQFFKMECDIWTGLQFAF